MKKYVILLSLFCPVTQAAQVISASDAQATLNALAAIPSPEKQISTLLKMESQLVTFSDGVFGFRFRYILAGWVPTRICWFVPFNDQMQLALQQIASGAPPLLHSVSNFTNNRWFVTNVAGPFNQADLDWCTQ